MPPMISRNDPQYVKAMSHPVRVRIMAMLEERGASPNELAGWLGTSLGSTAYHVRTLYKLGLIELVDERRVRGAVEHFYRAKARPKATSEEWSQASPIAEQATVGSRLKMLEAHTNASAAAGGFDRVDAVLERKTAQLDARGWVAMTSEASKFLTRLDKIEAEAASRIAKTGRHEDAIDAGVVLLVFESAALGDQIPTKQSARSKRTRRAAA